jgi:hypothetical protein
MKSSKLRGGILSFTAGELVFGEKVKFSCLENVVRCG